MSKGSGYKGTAKPSSNGESFFSGALGGLIFIL